MGSITSLDLDLEELFLKPFLSSLYEDRFEPIDYLKGDDPLGDKNGLPFPIADIYKSIGSLNSSLCPLNYY